MGKKRRVVIVAINVLLFFVLIGCALIPVERKTTSYTNTDTTAYKDMSDVPKVGKITNGESMKINFRLNGERLYGMNLYFYVEGNDMDGDIICTLEQDKKILAEQTVSVKGLSALMSKSEVRPKEIVMDSGEESSGEYVLNLKGSGLAPNTTVSLYGNENEKPFLSCLDTGESYAILYTVENLEKRHPFVWSCAFLLAMSLVFSFIICTSYKEK